VRIIRNREILLSNEELRVYISNVIQATTWISDYSINTKKFDGDFAHNVVRRN